MQRKDVTKAFPKSCEYDGKRHGMDLRDYFAAQVITHSYATNWSATELAEQAYETADAMMAQRLKR